MSPPSVEIRLLGPLQVCVAGAVVPPGGPRQRTALALLALEAGRVVSTDALAEAVWGDDAVRRDRRTLHVHIHNLRVLLGPDGHRALVTHDPGYLLDADLVDVDTHRWAERVEAARAATGRGDHEAAVAAYEEALRLHRGPLLEDLRSEVVEARRRQWEEEVLVVREEALDAELAAGRHAAVLGRLRALVAEHPLRERFWAQLMLALYRSGQQAEALDAYQQARRVLVEELGVDPGPMLQRLEESILRQAAGLEQAEATPAVHWLDAEGRPQRHALTPGTTVVVGRSPDCDVVLPFDHLVSRRHARFTWDGGSWKVHDDGSSNGTILNGEPIEGRAAVHDGDTVRCGETILVVVTLRGGRPAAQRQANFFRSTSRRLVP